MDNDQRLSCLAPILLAAEAAPREDSLPQCLYAALLEDPTPLLVGKNFSSESIYKEITIRWQVRTCSVAHQIEGRVSRMLVETSQDFARSLSFGRERCFRFHRFTLMGDEAFSMMHALTGLASRSKQCSSIAGTMRGSNIKGFQDVVNTEEPLMISLRAIFAQCVQVAAAFDTAKVTDMTPPNSPRGDVGFAAWMNISGKGALNMLHNHGTSSYAAVLYTSVPPMCSAQADIYQDKGALLFRLSRGSGSKFIEPDEDLHVARMSTTTTNEGDSEKCESSDGDAENCESSDGSIQYAKIQPQAGTLVVFPGWLPHSVTPHFDEDDRVCFASNWS